MKKPPCSQPVLKNQSRFRRVLAEWFGKEGKDYPWRRTCDPYEVLVSEVMLQQTRIATVLERGFYTGFLSAFPTVEDLAAAEDGVLLKAWEGLGYYRRARMLRDAARAVSERHGGVFPTGVDALMGLPGIGRYTAGALRAFAFGLPAVLVDGNVVRVLARLTDDVGDVHGTEGMKRMWSLAADLADDDNPRVHHSALMELGQTHCRPISPRCSDCPVAKFCATRDPDAVPVRKARVHPQVITEHAIRLCDSQGRVLLHCEQGSRMTGLWKLPLREAGEVEGLCELFEMNYSITRYRVRLRVVDGGVANGDVVMRDGEEWFRREDAAGLAMAAPFRRALSRLMKEF